jgi:hypothetical protein
MTSREDCHSEGGLDVGNREVERHPGRATTGRSCGIRSGAGGLFLFGVWPPERGSQMSLVSVCSPQSQTELDTIVALLEARDVPCFVRDSACGSTFHPAQLPLRASRTVMVPAHCLTRAAELIGQLHGLNAARESDSPHRSPRSLRGLLGLVLGACLVRCRGK